MVHSKIALWPISMWQNMLVAKVFTTKTRLTVKTENGKNKWILGSV